MTQERCLVAPCPKLLLFDLDGTLVDSFALFTEVFREASERFEFDCFDPRDVEFVRTLRADEVLSFYRVPPSAVSQVLAFVRHRMESRARELRLFPGVAAALRELHRKGHTLSLLTSNSLALATCSLGPDLMAMWAQVVPEVPLHKKADHMVQLRNQYPLLPCFAIGDEIRDFEATRAAAVEFIGVAWGYNSAQALERAGHHGRTLSSLKELVLLLGDGEED